MYNTPLVDIKMSLKVRRVKLFGLVVEALENGEIIQYYRSEDEYDTQEDDDEITRQSRSINLSKRKGRNPDEKRWIERFDEFMKYWDEWEKGCVPENVRNWYYNQRKLYKQGSLLPSRCKMLKEKGIFLEL